MDSVLILLPDAGPDSGSWPDAIQPFPFPHPSYPKLPGQNRWAGLDWAEPGYKILVERKGVVFGASAG